MTPLYETRVLDLWNLVSQRHFESLKSILMIILN